MVPKSITMRRCQWVYVHFDKGFWPYFTTAEVSTLHRPAELCQVRFRKGYFRYRPSIMDPPPGDMDLDDMDLTYATEIASVEEFMQQLAPDSAFAEQVQDLLDGEPAHEPAGEPDCNSDGEIRPDKVPALEKPKRFRSAFHHFRMEYKGRGLSDAQTNNLWRDISNAETEEMKAKKQKLEDRAANDMIRYKLDMDNYNRAVLLATKLVPKPEEDPLWKGSRKICPDDARDIPHIHGECFEDKDLLIARIVNLVFTCKYKALGEYLDMGRGLGIFEFLGLAPCVVMYFGITQQEVSAHVPDCLRNQWKFRLSATQQKSDVGPGDAYEISLEAITLLECLAENMTLMAIEAAVLRHKLVTCFAGRLHIGSSTSHCVHLVGRIGQKIDRLLYATFFVLRPSFIEPSDDKRGWDEYYFSIFTANIEAMRKGDPRFKDLLEVIEEYEKKVGRKIEF